MRKFVGIDRKIKRAWVDATLDRLAQTTDEAELRTFLDKCLKDELPGKESRAKTTGIILRIWSGIPPERTSLRDRAVAMLPRISGQERIWLHWGMTALAYPFFRDTAEVVGRLLALQDDFTTAQVQARMLTTWGDRATSKEAAQKLITTLVDWEVLRSTKTKGHFLLARKMVASIPDLQLWLLEALLGASAADEIDAQQLLRLPELFPFTLSIGVADLRRYEGFNIHRQGLDMDMVSLRRVKLEPPPKPMKRAKKKKTTRADHASLFDMKSEEVVSNNGKPVAIADVLINPTWEQVVQQEPLIAFSFYLSGRKNVLLAIADEIIENLDRGFSGTVNDGGRIERAESLMWLWTLGAYEVVRTMCQAKTCFSDRTFGDLTQLKKTLSAIRMPAAKMEKPGKQVPVSSNRSPSGWDVPNRDLLVGDPDSTSDVSARFILKEFERVFTSITKDDVLAHHEDSYPGGLPPRSSADHNR